MLQEISIDTEFIKLDQFLKYASVVQTGGQAKMMISEGIIKVNGEVVLERGRKIKKNDVVEIEDFDSFVVI
ncbi:S4 domain-containing protein YaaA [Tissierella sp. MSJ-40]|uniref:S4 domain-containing protein YaaA n=1 Tax=Tissierella simiarum TaxID=2841534 RepID=A0ABS6E4Y1_9FIRM|nr:S4 domain-containing protein YaaA [Tissierella simiarum]